MPVPNTCLVGIEGPRATTTPQCQQVNRILVMPAKAAEPGGDLQEGAEHGGAVVIGQRDQASLLDEPAQLDQVPGAGAPFCMVEKRSERSHGDYNSARPLTP